MDEEMKQLMERIGQANKSLQDRLGNEVHDIQYDSDGDVLYVGFGKVENAVSVELGDSEDYFYLRIEQQSCRIVGADIWYFRKSFLVRHPDARTAFEPLFQVFGDSDWRVQIRLPSSRESGQIALLVPAVRASLEYFPQKYIPQALPNLVSSTA